MSHIQFDDTIRHNHETGDLEVFLRDDGGLAKNGSGVTISDREVLLRRGKWVEYEPVVFLGDSASVLTGSGEYLLLGDVCYFYAVWVFASTPGSTGSFRMKLPLERDIDDIGVLSGTSETFHFAMEGVAHAFNASDGRYYTFGLHGYYRPTQRSVAIAFNDSGNILASNYPWASIEAGDRVSITGSYRITLG